MDESAMEPIDPRLVGRRLEALCEAIEVRPGHFADSIGMDRSSFSKILQGKKALPPRAAWKIFLQYRVDLNFIYSGQRDNLPTNLSSRLNTILQGKKA